MEKCLICDQELENDSKICTSCEFVMSAYEVEDILKVKSISLAMRDCIWENDKNIFKMIDILTEK